MVSFYRSFLKREARRFSANSVRVIWSFPALPCSMLGDSESNWQQRITPPAVSLLFNHPKIGKGAMNKLGFCSQRPRVLLLIIVLLFSLGRGAMTAPWRWNLRRGISPALAIVQRCLLRLCFPVVKGGTRSLAQSAVNFLSDISVVFQISNQWTRRRRET